jgi:hypothetical protein
MQIGVVIICNKISYQFNMIGKNNAAILLAQKQQKEYEETKEPPTENFGTEEINSNT